MKMSKNTWLEKNRLNSGLQTKLDIFTFSLADQSRVVFRIFPGVLKLGGLIFCQGLFAAYGL